MNLSRTKAKKAAIELSANFIVIIIISIVILAGGLMLFFKIKDSAQSYADKLDSQTQDKLRSVMLSNNYKTAIYPTDITIDNNKAELIGIGITNIYDVRTTFRIRLMYVKEYDSYNNLVGTISDISTLGTYYTLSNSTVDIAPYDQTTKGMLLRMPSNTTSGQYVYTINITSNTQAYGLQQVYVNNP